MTPNGAGRATSISEYQVRAALDGILASEQFARAKRSSDLLSYLVRRALAGDTENLKEYTVAIEVFGREESFDPRVDTVVRVEATRLRRRLKAYYEGVGANDPFRIELPAGGYVPVFLPAPEPVRAPASRFQRAAWATATFAVLALFGATVYFLSPGPPSGRALTQLRRVTLENGVYGYPALAPDRRWLVYASDRGSRNHLKLWRQPLDGGPAFQLTFGDYDDTAPAISPDSRWIGFESEQDHGGIRLMAASGGPSRQVANFGRGPRFSPDGEWLVYWVRDPVSGFGKVYRVPLNQPKEPQRLAPEFDDAHEPVWTPDGRHVLFCGTRRSGAGPEQEHNFWVAPIDFGPAINTQAFDALKRHGLDPHGQILSTTSFDFHGGKLVFAADSPRGSGLWQLAISDRTWQASGAPERLTDETAAAIHPSVQAPTIAFTSAIHNVDVWSAPLDARTARVTGPLQRQTDGAVEDLCPSVSGSGDVLVFFAGAPLAAELRRKEFPSGSEKATGR